MPRSTRQRMLDSAARLFREHGYSGTGFRDVVAHSNAPRGSIYHHFPGGKAQLGAEAIAAAGEFINELISKGVDSDDFVRGFERFWRWWIKYIEADEYRAGCPVVAVAVESHPEAPELAAAAAGVFSQWEQTVAESLCDAGIDDEQEALAIAGLILAALEGATVMARATGGREPLERVGQQLAAYLRMRIGGRRQTPRTTKRRPG